GNMAASGSSARRNKLEHQAEGEERMGFGEPGEDTPSEMRHGLRRADFSRSQIAQFHEQLRNTLSSFNIGDFSTRMPDGFAGVPAEIVTLLNAVISKNQALTRELTRVSGVVGREGRLGERASLVNLEGYWATNVEAVNSLIGELAR